MLRDLFEAQSKTDFLLKRSAQKSELMDSYAKMLSYTPQVQLKNSYSSSKNDSAFK